KFGVRAFHGCGEEKNLDVAVEIILDATGADVTNRPAAPTGLRASATAGGSIRVEWHYPRTRAPRAPTGFHVYTGTGGAPSYTTPVATVPYTTGIFNAFATTLSGLSDGTTYSISVRAYNGYGEEPNTVSVDVAADATGPGPVVGLEAVAI